MRHALAAIEAPVPASRRRRPGRRASVPRSYRSMSLESAPDRSYDVPPADERKGKTRAESDRRLGNLIVTHRSTIIRYPAGTMAPPRQKNVAGMNYWRRPAAIRPMSAESRGAAHAVAGSAGHDSGQEPDAWAGFVDSAKGHCERGFGSAFCYLLSASF